MIIELRTWLAPRLTQGCYRYTLDNKSTAELQELLEMSAGILIGLATERAGLHHRDKTHLDLEILSPGVNLGSGGNLVSRRSGVITECLLGHCWRPLFPILTINFSRINWALHHVPYIFYLILTNSTSCGGLRWFVGLCSEYARNNTKWSIYKDRQTWVQDDTIIDIVKNQIWHCHVEELVEMIELDIWFTQFGVRMQKLCKLQVSDSCRAEAAGWPARHLCQTHLTLQQDH